MKTPAFDPATHVIVPREPDYTMLGKGVEAIFDMDHSALKMRDAVKMVKRGWKAMLAAAPPASPEPQNDEAALGMDDGSAHFADDASPPAPTPLTDAEVAKLSVTNWASESPLVTADFARSLERRLTKERADREEDARMCGVRVSEYLDRIAELERRLALAEQNAARYEKPCPHSFIERQMAVEADGMCPLCLAMRPSQPALDEAMTRFLAEFDRYMEQAGVYPDELAQARAAIGATEMKGDGNAK